MATDPADRYKRAAQNYLRYIESTYIFDASTGIHKPKATETAEERQRKNAGTNPESRFFTNPRTDWRPILIASLISLGTLILLIFTVHYARLQWIEMIRSADATTTAANAATSAAVTAQLALSVQRAYITVDSVELSADGKHVYITGRNTGITQALDVNIAPKITAFGGHYSADEMLTEKNLPPPYSLGDVARETSFKTFRDLSDDSKWTEALIGIRAGQVHAYVYGTITYRDVFSKTIYPYNFCFTYDATSQGFFLCPINKFMQAQNK